MRGRSTKTFTTKAFTTAELLVVCVICLIVLLTFSDAVSNAKYNSRAAVCKANFNQLRLAVQSYQASHAGKMPPTLKTLLPITGSQGVFECPLSSTEATPVYHTVSYEYRFLSKPTQTDVICWDSHPHRPYHTVFVWLNRPNRNVLLADGQVENMREEEFQRLHLQGQNWTIQ